MNIPYRNDCIQGREHVNEDLFPIQKLWRQDTLHYSQRGRFIHLVLLNPQGLLSLLGEQIARVFPSLMIMFQHSHHNLTAVRPRCSLQRTRRSCFSVSYTQVSFANRVRWVPGATGHRLYIDCTMLGQGRSLEAPCLYLSACGKFAFCGGFTFSVSEKRKN
jgi:hypothetical protein